jgi:hypothetical protein
MSFAELLNYHLDGVYAEPFEFLLGGIYAERSEVLVVRSGKASTL